MQDILKPPVYCPDAIATDVGWINPKTGELLVTVRNLRQRIKEHVLSVEFNREDNKSETEKILEQLTEITVAQETVDERSDTQRALDALTQQVIIESQEVHDEQTEQQTESVTITKENNNITIGIKESTEVAEAVNKPKRPGRPKKQANEQSK